MTPVRPFWQTGSHALIVRNVISPRAQVFALLLLSPGAFMIAAGAPIRLQRVFRTTLAN
jgi:hypothetical protein